MSREYIRVNLPNDMENYENGNGEGCWALADPIVKAAYDNDEEGTEYTVELCNDSLYYPGLISGTEIPIRMMGEYRPVAIYDWLINHYGESLWGKNLDEAF